MSTENNQYVPPKKSLWERSYRPIIYIAAFLCVLLGTSSEDKLVLNVGKNTKGIVDTVENLPTLRQAEIKKVEQIIADKTAELDEDGADVKELKEEIFAQQEHLSRLNLNTNGVLLVCMDFDPGTSPELQPMAMAILQQCFAKGIKVVGNVGYNAVTAQLANNIFEKAAIKGLETGKYPLMIDGLDYTFLGFKPSAFNVYLQMGEDIITAYETDYANNDLNSLTIMRGIHDITEIDAIVSLTAYVGGPEQWINVGKTKFNKKVGIGMTAVSAADYYPYVQSGQIVGLLAGLRGAAEYETAIGCPGKAIDRMRPQLYAHTLAIFLIIIGNLEFFIAKFLKFLKK